MDSNRTKATAVNASVAMIVQAITLFGQFFVQIIFARVMGAAFLGANGLFGNVISFLAFTELGIGWAMTYSLYKPLAEKDWVTVSAIMDLFRRVYRIIGVIILLLGLAIAPFIPHFVKAGVGIPNLVEYFVLYLFGTVVTYFFTTSRTLVTAIGFAYLNLLNIFAFKTLQIIGQLVVILYLKNYALFLIIVVFTNFISNFVIDLSARKRFPLAFEKNDTNVPDTIMHYLKRNVVGTISTKIGSIVINGTDNLVISKFVGLTSVGFYSNYVLITSGVMNIVSQMIGSTVASFGNLGATSDVRKQENVYYESQYIVALLTIVITTNFLLFVQPVVSLLFGNFYVLPSITVFLIALNFGYTIIRSANRIFHSALGLYWQMRYLSVIEASVNLLASLSLTVGLHMGINGVVLGTLISSVFVNSWWEIRVIFRDGLQLSAKKAISKYYFYLVIMFTILALIYYFLMGETQGMGWMKIVLGIIAGVISSAALFLVVTFWQKETNSVLKRMYGLVKR